MADPRPCPPHVAAAFTLPEGVMQDFALRTLKEQLAGTRVVLDPAERAYVVFQHEWVPPHAGHTLDLYVHRAVHDILATSQALERVEVAYFAATRLETV